MTPEGKVKKFIRQHLSKFLPGCWIYCPPGGAFGRAGVPDFLILYKGVMIAIEAKADSGRATKLQIKRLLELRDNGCVAAIVKGEDLDKLIAIKNKVEQIIKERNHES